MSLANFNEYVNVIDVFVIFEIGMEHIFDDLKRKRLIIILLRVNNIIPRSIFRISLQNHSIDENLRWERHGHKRN